MYKCQLINNPNIFESEEIPIFFKLCGDGVYRPSVPAVRSDLIVPTLNHADGKVYDSWSQFKSVAEDKGFNAHRPNAPLDIKKRENKINEKQFDKAFKDAVEKHVGV